MSCCKASRALALLSPPASFTHDFQHDETWDHPPCQPATSAAAAKLPWSKFTWRDGHSPADRRSLYVSLTLITTYVAISADNRRQDLCWDTAWSPWIQAAADRGGRGRTTSRRHGCWLKQRPGDISSASFSDFVQRLHMLRAYLEANGCLNYSWWWECACRGGGVGFIDKRRVLRLSAHSAQTHILLFRPKALRLTGFDCITL